MENKIKNTLEFVLAYGGVTRLLLLPCTVAKNIGTYTHGQCPSL